MRASKSPSQITCRIIHAGMSAEGMSVHELAKRTGVHHNTVYTDLKQPEKIPQDRLWLYFTILNVPVENALARIAAEFAEMLTRR